MKAVALILSTLSIVLGNIRCELCFLMVKELKVHLNNPSLVDRPAEFFQNLCLNIQGPAYEDICKGLVDEFKYIVLSTLIDKFVDPDYLCQKIESCSGSQVVSHNFTEYAEKIMQGKPAGPGPQPTGQKSFQFIHISDIHLDKYYSPGTLSVCDIPQCCRAGNGTEGNTAGYWGGLVCDLPVHTLYPALDQIKQLDPEFILITGDFPPHDVWNQSREKNIEYDQIVSKAFRSAFPETPIYVIFGNHACYPINQCSFESDEYWIPKHFSEHWGLGKEIRGSLEEHAGYSVMHKDTNLRILILDTNVFNDGSLYIMNNSTNPKGQLNWIHNQLLEAEKKKEQVYIIGHMPPGDADALPTWAKHFNVLVDRFEYTIAGLFFGHSHADELHIHRGVYSNLPTKVQWVAPSFTTYSYLNPSFRLFTADQDSKQLLDFTQFRLNLTNANLYPDVKPVWGAAYSFKEFYGLSDINPQSVYELASLMGKDKNLCLKYVSNFFSGGQNAPGVCDRYCMYHYTCKMLYPDFDSVFKCQGLTIDAIFYKALGLLFNNWSYRVI